MTTARKLVGPLIRGMNGEIADAVLIAMENDNPDIDLVYSDEVGYIRINAYDRCRLTQESFQEAMGRPISLAELEPALSGFAGRMNVTETEIVWFLERQD